MGAFSAAQYSDAKIAAKSHFSALARASSGPHIQPNHPSTGTRPAAVIPALFKSLAQISDPRFRRVWLKGFAYSVLLFLVIVALAWFLLAQIDVVGIGWIDWVIAGLGGLGFLVIAFIMFPGLALIVIGTMLEEIARAVEARHYPDLPPPRDQRWGEIIATSSKLIGLTAMLNIAALPLYLIPVLNFLVFYALNGILLGREYYDLVSLRRLEPRQAAAVRGRRRFRLFADGVIIAFLLSIPFIGWTMAVVAAAFMVHEFETIKE